MELTGSEALTLLTLIVLGPLAWIVKSLASDLKDLRDRQAKHETHVAEAYVEKDDLHRQLDEIKGMLRGLFEKWDEAHKHHPSPPGRGRSR